MNSHSIHGFVCYVYMCTWIENSVSCLIICFAEPVVSFALEPTGSKFIVIHGEPPTRIMASFYNINDKGNKVALLSKSNLGAATFGRDIKFSQG